MREVSADAWSVEADVLCITTNCTIKNGCNVMGGGIARGAASRDPDLPYNYANLIQRFGHHVYLMMLDYQEPGWGVSPYKIPVLMFPTKNEVWENSSLKIIEQSLYETLVLAQIYGWGTVAIPRPGSGLGGLDWHSQVKPLVEKFHDGGRFLIVSYPGEK